VRAWIKGYSEPVLLVRQVFTNKDRSVGKLYLICSDLSCDFSAIITIYKKRWNVEGFYISLKSNANMAKSPTRTIRTQSNYIFMAICATFKLECLSLKSKLNPFALSRQLLINACRGAYAQL